MIYGYIRVFTAAQELEAQFDRWAAAGYKGVFHDKLSGLNSDRSQLWKMLASVEADDTVIISAIDRLSREMTDLLSIACDLQVAAPLGAKLQHEVARAAVRQSRAIID